MSIFITPKQSGVIGKLNKHNSCLLYLTCDEIWTFFLSRPRKLQFSYFFFLFRFSAKLVVLRLFIEALS